MKTFKNLRISLLGIASILALGSCLRSPSELAIPKDVLFAGRANILRATYQLPNWKEILREEFSIDIESDSMPRTNFLGSAKAYVFGDLLDGDKNYVALAIKARNPRSLQRFVTSMNPDLQVQTYKRFKYLIKNKSLLAWSNNLLLLLDARQAPTQDHIIEHFQRIAHLKAEESLVRQNANFRRAIGPLNHRYDIVAWINSEELANTQLLRTFAEQVDLKDNYFHFYANFDEGRISMQTKYYTNDTFYDAYKTLLSRQVAPGIIKNSPVEDPAVLLSVAVEPSAINTFLQDIQWTEKAKNLVNAVTLSLEDFLKMLSGDVVMILKDVANLESKPDSLAKDSTFSLKDHKAISDLVIGVGIKDEVIYDSLVSTLRQTGIMERKENYDMFFNEIYILRRDSLLYLTKNEAIKDDFLRGVNCSNAKVLEMVDNNNWFILYANEGLAEKTIKGRDLLKSVARNILKNEEVELEYATINLGSTKSGDKADKYLIEDGQSIVLLKDKQANSLVAMLEILKEIVIQTKLRLDPNFFDGSISNE